MLVFAAATLLFGRAGLSIGRSTVDITPDVPLPLGGYTERGTKVSVPGGDHLYARTVLFESGNTKIAVVSVETLTIPESFVREVKKRIPSDVFLFLSATHTHSAPDSQMLNDRMTFSIPGIASFKRQWLDWYADKIASGVREALTHREEVGQIDVHIGHADMNVGRRKFADPDKTVTGIYSYDWQFPQPVGMINGKLLLDPEGHVIPEHLLIVNYAAHGTVYGDKNLQTRGDWPGVAAKTIRTRLAGTDFQAGSSDSLFLQGAIGDVLPRQWGPTDDQSIWKIVSALSKALDNGARVDVWSKNDPVSTVSFPVALDPAMPHPTMGKSYGVPEAFAQGIVKQFAPPSASITAFRIGKLAVVGVPGEPTSILGKQIRDAGRRMGFESVLVCSHVNGWMGYILDPEDYDRGGYEATLSFYGREEGAKVVEAGVKALRALSVKR